MTLSRRNLLAAASAGSLFSVMPGLSVAFGAPAEPQSDIMVFLFARFGMDGLSMIAPADDGAYRDARPTIAVTPSGFGAGLHLDDHQGTPFFMYPAARQLHQMYKDGSLAIIHAAGVPTENRSHFETQEMVTRGLADGETLDRRGWLTRHMLAKGGQLGDFDAVSDGQGVTSTLDGMGGSLSFGNLASLGYAFYGDYGKAIAAMHKGETELDKSMQKAMRVAGAIREKAQSIPYENTANNYTYGPLSNTLKPLAQVLKLDIGVKIASADFIGWDHHEYLPNNFTRQSRELGDALFAFMDDLGPLAKRVTVVIMTEFGRRVRENTNNGTDHGAGSTMMVMGAGVNGGKFYGDWPGLKSNVLDQGDVPVVTDYRQILGELLVKRQGQKKIDEVFPNIPYKPLGIFKDA